MVDESEVGKSKTGRLRQIKKSEKEHLAIIEQLQQENQMLRQKVAALEIAGSQTVATGLRDASKAQQEDNAAKPKRKESRSSQEEKLNFVIEQAGLISWDWDIEHDRKVFNAIWAEKLSYTLEEFNSALQESSLDYFQHTEDIPAAQQAMKDCLTGKTPLYRAEYRMRTKTGDWKWMLALGKIIERNAEGKPILMTGVNLDISERKQAEEALRESEARYRALLEAIPDKIIHYRKDGTHLAVKIPSDYIATTQYDLDNRPNITQIDPELAPRVLSCLQQVVETGETQVLEYEAMRGDEKEYREARYAAINQDEIVAIVRDITERKRVEDALRESEERFRTLVESIPGEVYRCLPTPPWRIIHNSAKNETIIGYLVSDFLEGSLLYSDFILSEDLEMVNSALEAGIACKKPYIVEYRIHHADGSNHWLAERGRAVYSEQGEPLWLDGVIFDITERKQAEEALRDSEQRFRTLFEQAAVGVALVEIRTGRYIRINQKYCDFLGYTKEEMLLKSFQDVTYPQDTQTNVDNNALLLAGKISEFSIEKRYVRKDGTVVWGRLTASPLWTPSEKPDTYFHIAVVEDITERKRVEEALRESESRFRTLVETSPDAISLTDLNGKFLAFNHAFVMLYGFETPEEMNACGMTAFDTIAEPERPRYMKNAAKTMEEGFNINAEYMTIRRDGTSFPMEVSASVIRDADGTPSAFMAISRDITERKQAEEALRIKDRAITTSINAITMSDLEGNLTYVNPAFLRLWGYVEEKEVLGKPVVWRDEEKAAEIIEMLQTRGNWVGESIAQRKDSSLFDVQLAATMVTNETGRPICMLGSFIDITERKRAEDKIRQLNVELEHRVEERTAELLAATSNLEQKFSELEQMQDTLQESEVKYRIVADKTYAWEYWRDPNGQYIYVSPSCLRITGYDREAFLQDASLSERIIHPEDRSRVQNHIKDIGQEKAPDEIRYHIIKPDGTVAWIGHVCQPVYDEQGTFLGRRGSNRDITAQVGFEETLREITWFNQEIITGAGEGVVVCDGLFQIMVWNPYMEKLTGIPAEQVLGGQAFDLFPQIKEMGIDQMLERALTGETVDADDMLFETAMNDKFVWASATYTPRCDADGNIIGVIATVHDVTERKQVEEKIRQHATRAEALARMAARLNAQLDLDTVLKAVCEEAVHALSVPASCVLLYDEAGDSFYMGADVGLSPLYRQHWSLLQPARHGQYTGVATDSPLILDVQAVPGLLKAELIAEMDVRTTMWYTMRRDERLIGQIVVISTGEGRRFTKEEQSLLKGLAAQAAGAIANSLLFEQVSDGRKHLQVLSQQLVEVQEAERRALALELHDELGQVLNSVKLSLDMIPTLPEPQAFEQLRLAQSLVKDMVGRVRQMALELRPSMLDDLGLLPALQWLFRNHMAETGEMVDFQYNFLDQRFPSNIEITAFRIVQEALTNITRHAGVTKASVHIWLDKESLNLQITDQGSGFDMATLRSPQESSGLSGMRERARLLGGELVIESTPGAGTSLTAILPLADSKPESE